MSPAAIVRADIAALELAPGAFDAVTAFYSLIHVPRDRQAALFRRIHTWLRPGGLFLASLSAGGGADTVEDRLGVPMFFSGFDADTDRVLLADAGSRRCSTSS